MQNSTLENKVKGCGENKHLKAKSSVEIPFSSLIKSTTNIKKANKPCEIKAYQGNPLDSSQPLRYKGKHREDDKKRQPSKVKSSILKDEQKRIQENVTNTINYCDNYVTDDLNEATKCFIKKIVHLQDNAHVRNPTRAKMKRRYVVGFHEIKKYMFVKKVKVLIIAADLKAYSNDDELYKIIMEMKDLSKQFDVPLVFALKRSKIGNFCNKKRPISCFGVLNYQSAEDEYKSMMECIQINNDQINAIKTDCAKEESIDEVNESVIKTFQAILL